MIYIYIYAYIYIYIYIYIYTYGAFMFARSFEERNCRGSDGLSWMTWGNIYIYIYINYIYIYIYIYTYTYMHYMSTYRGRLDF